MKSLLEKHRIQIVKCNDPAQYTPCQNWKSEIISFVIWNPTMWPKSRVLEFIELSTRIHPGWQNSTDSCWKAWLNHEKWKNQVPGDTDSIKSFKDGDTHPSKSWILEGRNQILLLFTTEKVVVGRSGISGPHFCEVKMKSGAYCIVKNNKKERGTIEEQQQ